jgi:hypothetical protein
MEWYVIEKFCDWLSATNISVAFQSTSWFVPLVQTVHIMSIAVLLVSVYVIGLRLVGLRGRLPLAAVAARSTPWIWVSLCVLLASGVLLTITEPARELLKWVFRVKMLMVLLLAGILLIVQSRLRQNPEYWTQSSGRRRMARVVGMLSLLIGACIVTAGRWIAYV